MRNHNQKSLLSRLNRIEVYLFIGFMMITSYIAGNDFVPTIKFLFQWLHSHFTPTRDNYPNSEYFASALFFFSKTGALVLTSLLVAALCAIYFGPAIGFTNVLKKLTDDKNTLVQTLRDYVSTLEHMTNFIKTFETHQRTIISLISHCEKLIEDLNFKVMNTKKATQDLALVLHQLEAISAALQNDLSPPDKSDQGGF